VKKGFKDLAIADENAMLTFGIYPLLTGSCWSPPGCDVLKPPSRFDDAVTPRINRRHKRWGFIVILESFFQLSTKLQ